MSPLPRLSSLLRNLFRKDRVERDLDSEVSAYLDQLVEEKISAGMAPEQARRAARIEVGGREQVKEQVRAVRAGALLEQLVQDIRYGAGQLLRSPGFMLVAVVTLALGIGANTVVFSVVNAVLLQPLPFPRSERLVLVWETDVRRPGEPNIVSWPNYEDWKGQNRVFQSIGVFDSAGRGYNLSGADEPEQVFGVYADMKHWGLDAQAQPEFLRPYMQAAWPSMDIAVRTAAAPEGYRRAILKALAEIEPGQPVSGVQTMEEVVSDSV